MKLSRIFAVVSCAALAMGGCTHFTDQDAAARRRIAESPDVVAGVREYIDWCVDSRLKGRSAEESLPRFLDYTDNAPRWHFSFNPKFWAGDVDFSCVSPWNDRFRNQRAGTAISSVHIVFANHYPFTPGTKLSFIGSDGSLHVRSYLSGVRVAGTDLMVGLLDRPLPPTVRPAAILPDDYADYIGNAADLPAVTFDQEEKLIVTELWQIPSSPEATNMMSRNMKFKPAMPKGAAGDPKEVQAFEERLKRRAKRAEFYEHLITGDSGNPCFMIVGREPILLYTVHGGGPGSGPALQKLRGPLQAAMDSMEPGHALRVFDFGKLATPPVRFADADRPFIPKVAPKAPASAKLRILPGRNMAFVSAKLDGRECTLLFDTGATHTTFDIGFLKRELPEKKLGDVMLAGTTNVEGAPKIFHADSLKVGDAEFADFEAMALDLSRVAPGMGVKLDGILGMNVIGCVPSLTSFGGGRVVFAPSGEDCAGFGEGIARFRGDPMSVAMMPSLGGRRVGLIVDSAASLTFLDKSTGWPSTGETVSFGAVDVNGGSSMSTEKGKKGSIGLGTDVEISPLLVGSPMNRIGADTLLAYDMLVDMSKVRFRKFGGAD